MRIIQLADDSHKMSSYFLWKKKPTKTNLKCHLLHIYLTLQGLTLFEWIILRSTLKLIEWPGDGSLVMRTIYIHGNILYRFFFLSGKIYFPHFFFSAYFLKMHPCFQLSEPWKHYFHVENGIFPYIHREDSEQSACPQSTTVNLSLNTRKCIFRHLCPAKIRSALPDQSSLATSENFGPLAVHWAHSKFLIRLCGCAGWCESSLGTRLATVTVHFARVVTKIKRNEFARGWWWWGVQV